MHHDARANERGQGTALEPGTNPPLPCLLERVRSHPARRRYFLFRTAHSDRQGPTAGRLASKGPQGFCDGLA
jgi:hypothetical protein